MSYILDALRRADSERERGSVPGIHAQPVPLVSDDEPRPQRPRASVPALWVVCGAGAILIAALAWSLLGREAPPVAAAAPSVVVPAMPPPVPAPLAAAPSPALAPMPVAPAPEAGPRKPGPIEMAAAPPQAARPAAKAEPAAKPASAETRVLALNELPEEVRRALPALVVGGAMYSETPANRMLIINGQLLHEGDKVAPDLTLEQIKLKAAVLKFKGYRYGIVY